MQCTSPLPIHGDSGPQTVNCGGCIPCRVRRGQETETRGVHEWIHRGHVASAITLTYDDEHIPYGHSLDHRDVQLFIKSLRNTGFDFSYLMCGEYGEETSRPHYHLVLFGVDFLAEGGCRYYKTSKAGIPLYNSRIIEDAWKRGYAPIQAVTRQAIGYVCGYTLKAMYGQKARDEYALRNPDGSVPFVYGWRGTPGRTPIDITTGRDTWEYRCTHLEWGSKPAFQRKRPYVQLSKRPCLGWNHFWKHHVSMLSTDTCIVDEKPRPVPKHYVRRLTTGKRPDDVDEATWDNAKHLAHQLIADREERGRLRTMYSKPERPWERSARLDSRNEAARAWARQKSRDFH